MFDGYDDPLPLLTPDKRDPALYIEVRESLHRERTAQLVVRQELTEAAVAALVNATGETNHPTVDAMMYIIEEGETKPEQHTELYETLG